MLKFPEPGDLVRVWRDGLILEGIVMPNTEFSSENILIIKLSNGYNVGVDLSKSRVEVIKERAYEVGKIPEPTTTSVRGSGEGKLKFISTGGTIASRVEYETGAVKPAINAEELIEMVPEYLEGFSTIEVLELYRLLSEDLTPSHWERISEEIFRSFESGADTVVVAHGTDTMGYTAAALAFSLQKLPAPVMLVGAQRSSDRPSTDSVINLKACAVIGKEAPFGEVVVVMHGSSSDSYVLAHRGVKVRKMHSSRRDAFQSINDVPLARVDFPSKKFVLINKKFIKRHTKEELTHLGKFSNKAALIKFYPNLDCSLIDYLIDRGMKGLVLEGTGLGHVRNACTPTISRAVGEGAIVVMTTQTLFGRVNMKVYTTGRKLIKAGVLPASDILPETAYVKLSWLLGNYPSDDAEELKQKFLTNYVNEFNPSHDEVHFPRWYHGG